MSDRVCPLCRGTKRMRRPRRLYDARVCGRCHSSFANRRQFAFVVDAFAHGLLFVLATIGLGMGLAVFGVSDQVMLAVTAALLALTYGLFPIIFMGKDGFGSPGRKLFGLTVVHRASGLRVGFWRSVLRNLPLLIPFGPLFIALSMLKGGRLGDDWANTRVVWNRYEHHPLFTGLPVCAQCTYDLTGNTSGVCPECGTPVAVSTKAIAPPPAPVRRAA